MKRILFILFAPIFLLVACDEIPPVINPAMPGPTEVCLIDVDVTNQQRNISIEEYTGVRCNNCPAGAEIIKNILADKGERVTAMSIHAGGFSPPLPESLYDFRNPTAMGLFGYLGEPLAYPASVINRVPHGGNSALPTLSKDTWNGLVTNELTKPLVVKLGIAHVFDTDTRELGICTKIFPQQNIDDEDVRISVFITENHIIDYQLSEMGTVPDYEHMHVLRTSATAFDGNLLTEDLTAGSTIERAFLVELPADWNAANCEIIAMVSKGGADKEVLQVTSVHVQF